MSCPDHYNKGIIRTCLCNLFYRCLKVLGGEFLVDFLNLVSVTTKQIGLEFSLRG